MRRTGSIAAFKAGLLAGFLLACGLTACAPGRLRAQGAAPRLPYRPAPSASESLTRGSTRITVLVDSAALGGSELEVAEVVLPPSGPVPAPLHRHGSAELLYALSGELDHVVNGRTYRLTPGMIGIVRPPDSVAHRVASSLPVRALVIWSPGGELGRIRPAFERAPPLQATDDSPARLRQRWVGAYQRGSVEAMAGLYTEDATRMPYDANQERGRAAVLAAYAAAFSRRQYDPAITLSAEEVVDAGPVTVERGRYREVLRSRTGQPTLLEEGKYVTLAELGGDGVWRYRWSIFNRDAPARRTSGNGGTR